MKGTVFLDRDGVICENRPDYVKSWDEFVFLPQTFTALAALNQAGYRVIVVTNQSAVGRGLLSPETLHEIHSRMITAIQQHGGHIDRVVHCPHRPDDNCNCRKPRPGMLLTVAQELGLDLRQAYLIGDAYSDIQAGQAVGCRCSLVLTGRGQAQLPLALGQAPPYGEYYATTGFQVAADLNEAVKRILDGEWRMANGE